MLKRSVSWKQLLNLHKQEFLVWLDQSGQRIKMFNKLADDLDRSIISCLTFSSYGEDLPTLCKKFIDCIPPVFTNCDDPEMYKGLMAAVAYAHVYMLERYRRSWDILIQLMRAAVLPMSDKEIEVLDIGTGPAPAQYAVFDFYQALREFANEKGYEFLTPQPLNLSCVESSQYMAFFMNFFSEESNRPAGPFHRTFIDFGNLNFAQLREKKRWEIRRGKDYYDYETDSWETWYEDEGDLGWTEGIYRYNLVIFSNFLTTEDEVENWREALLSTFSTVRHGGIVLVTGGSGEKYQSIYEIVSEIAQKTGLQKVPSASTDIDCNYTDTYAQRIKKHYNTVWRWIKANTNIDDNFLRSYTIRVGGKDRKIAKKLWNPDTKLKGSASPEHFTLLAFRRSGRPWRAGKKAALPK